MIWVDTRRHSRTTPKPSRSTVGMLGITATGGLRTRIWVDGRKRCKTTRGPSISHQTRSTITIGQLHTRSWGSGRRQKKTGRARRMPRQPDILIYIIQHTITNMRRSTPGIQGLNHDSAVYDLAILAIHWLSLTISRHFLALKSQSSYLSDQGISSLPLQVPIHCSRRLFHTPLSILVDIASALEQILLTT